VNVVISLDYGGTAIKEGIVSERGKLLCFGQTPTGSTKFSQVANKLAARIKALQELAKERKNNAVACAIGSPGLISYDRKIIYTSPNFESRGDFNLYKALRARKVNLPIFIENDANVAALGEYWKGAGKGARCLILLTLGTGIGGGVVVDGKLWLGAHGMGGELGHVTVDPRGAKCGCGNYGCLEALASATAVVREFKKAIKSGEESGLAVSSEIGAKEIAEAARKGDVLAKEIFSKSGTYLGIALASMINEFDPDVIVLGGGMSPAFDLLESSMTRELNRRAFSKMVEKVKVIPAKLGNKAGIYGAAFLAFQKLSEV